jgi:hypothetical protein
MIFVMKLENRHYWLFFWSFMILIDLILYKENDGFWIIIEVLLLPLFLIPEIKRFIKSLK